MSKGAPVSVETIVVPDPGPGEAVVAIQACGVCHTDLHYREGGINDEFPFLLGHEAAGVVESVGDGVSEVGPGDYVILNWRAVCGNCRACLRGEPQYCFNTHNASQKMTLDRRHRAVAGARDRRVLREDPRRRRAVHQGRRRRPGHGGRAARVRRDGRHRRGDQHRRRAPRPVGRRLRLRRGRRRGDRRREAGRRVDDHRGSTSTTASWSGPRASARPTSATRQRRPGGFDPVGHRRVRRRCLHRGDRQARGVQAGVRGPRPRRHGRARRGADAGDDDRAAVPGGLRARRRAQVVAGTATACRRATSRC